MKKLKRIKKLTISRERWGRGSTGGSLLDIHGRMCCLGFGCLAAGLEEEDIQGHGYPSNTPGSHAIPLFRKADGTDTALCESAACINDDKVMDDAEREAKIKALFAQKRYGVKVRFVP